MNKTLKTILSILLALVIAGLVYLIYESVMEPVRFNKDAEARERVAIQQLKDIRDLQVAFKSVNNKFTASFDSLKQFYNAGQMVVLMQVGSKDDSLAVAHTAEVKKAKKGITDAGLYQLYKAGDQNLVFAIQNKIAVKDTLFTSRPDFNIDEIAIIPSFGEDSRNAACADTIELNVGSITSASGFEMPLFEAKVPFRAYLNNLNEQEVTNRVTDRELMDKFPGMMVGDATQANNNAGNWE